MKAVNNFEKKNQDIIQTYRTIKTNGGEIDPTSILDNSKIN